MVVKGIISHTPGSFRYYDKADIRNNPEFYNLLARDAKYWSTNPDVVPVWRQIFKELTQRFRQKAAYRKAMTNYNK